jgi:hypothetical protein
MLYVIKSVIDRYNRCQGDLVQTAKFCCLSSTVSSFSITNWYTQVPLLRFTGALFPFEAIILLFRSNKYGRDMWNDTTTKTYGHRTCAIDAAATSVSLGLPFNSDLHPCRLRERGHPPLQRLPPIGSSPSPGCCGCWCSLASETSLGTYPAGRQYWVWPQTLSCGSKPGIPQIDWGIPGREPES